MDEKPYNAGHGGGGDGWNFSLETVEDEFEVPKNNVKMKDCVEVRGFETKLTNRFVLNVTDDDSECNVDDCYWPD